MQAQHFLEAPKKLAAKRKVSRAPKVLTVRKVRKIRQVLAAASQAFLPVGSFWMAHHEAVQEGAHWKWALVAAALTASAPAVAEWAQSWAGNKYKAWGFTALLEGVLIGSDTWWLGGIGLAILIAVNADAAWARAGKAK